MCCCAATVNKILANGDSAHTVLVLHWAPRLLSVQFLCKMLFKCFICGSASKPNSGSHHEARKFYRRAFPIFCKYLPPGSTADFCYFNSSPKFCWSCRTIASQKHECHLKLEGLRAINIRSASKLRQIFLINTSGKDAVDKGVQTEADIPASSDTALPTQAWSASKTSTPALDCHGIPYKKLPFPCDLDSNVRLVIFPWPRGPPFSTGIFVRPI